VIGKHCTFPGDQGLGEDAYAAMLAVSPAWLTGVDSLVTAARAFRVPVSSETLERWLRAWACAYILDRLLDDSEDRAPALDVYGRLLRSLGTEPNPLPPGVGTRVPTSVALLMSSLADTGSRDRVIRLALRMGELAPQKVASSRPSAYARLIRRENTIFGQLLADCMSATERDAAGFRAFRRWCSMYMTAWGMLDAVCDLRTDYAKQKVSIRFTRSSQALLRAHTVWVWTKVILRHPRAFHEVGMSIEAIQRLRAEDPPASADTAQG
jgi:hypothetical protein